MLKRLIRRIDISDVATAIGGCFLYWKLTDEVDWSWGFVLLPFAFAAGWVAKEISDLIWTFVRQVREMKTGHKHTKFLR